MSLTLSRKTERTKVYHIISTKAVLHIVQLNTDMLMFNINIIANIKL